MFMFCSCSSSLFQAQPLNQLLLNDSERGSAHPHQNKQIFCSDDMGIVNMNI